MEFFKPGRYIDIMSQKNIWLTISSVICLASILALIFVGLNFGTDFRGGTEIELAFKQKISTDDIVQAAKVHGFSEPRVIHVEDRANPNRYMLRVQEVSAVDDRLLAQIHEALCFASATGVELPERCTKQRQPTELKVSPGGDKISLRYDHDPDVADIKALITQYSEVKLREGENNPQIVSARDQKVEIQLKSKGDQLIDGLRAGLGSEIVPDEPLRVEWIGPKAGKLLRDAAFKSIALSLIAIMAYIAIRFDLRFAPGAIVSLGHNTAIVLGIYVLFRFEFTLMTVASLLTLIGYSINDTVVVYDRIRENLGKHRGKPFAYLVNLSVSETLSRTILTVSTTFLVLVPYLLLPYVGSFLPYVGATRGEIWYFALSFAIGIVIAPYASIFVAAPVTELIDRRVFGGTRSTGPKGPVRKRETAVV